MMLLTAAISFLAGSLIGLRFNVKAVALTAMAAIVFFAAEALAGQASVASAAITAGIAVMLLQVGYFSSLALAAMGYVPAIAPHVGADKPAATTTARRQRSNS
ncbi:MAG: hypothetical protein P4L82_16850 [Ancalomicrobiaceae bacterium]|nr:hypothetical protein [Ancalomicrobiaceae bacterium]